MKASISLIIFLLCNVYCNAQQTDVVTLKDGSIYKGTISEYVPNGKLIMALVDGRSKELNSSDVKSLDEGANKAFVSKEKGFFHASSAGALIGSGVYQNDVNFQYNMVNGYKWKNFYVGLGTGIETARQLLLTPFYGDLLYQFSKEKTSPFVSVQLGRTVNFAHKETVQNYYADNFKSGNMAGLSFGLKNNFNSQLALIVSAGYRYYDLEGDYDNQWWDGQEWLTYPVETNTYLHRFNLKLGLLFN